MFIVSLGTVLALMHLYVWKRLIKNTSGGRIRWMLTAIFLTLLALLVATLFLPRLLGWRESPWVAWPGFVWFGLVVYLFLMLLVLEPLRLALRGWVKRSPPQSPEPETQAMNRRVFLARASAVAAGAASVGLVGVGMDNALGPPHLLRLPVRLGRLDPLFNGFRIAVVSDIHLGPLAGRTHTERIVRMINEAEPDLVAIVGDLVDGTVAELGSAAEPLQHLASREGTFFVTGNHEYFVDDTSSWLRELDRLGVQPLRNESTVIRRGAAAFDLVGVNDVAGEKRSDPPDFDRALSGVDAIAADDSACPPTGSGQRGRRAWRRPTTVRAHPRRSDVAVPLHRARCATVPRRAVDRRRDPAVRHTRRRLLGAAATDRCAARHHRVVSRGRTLT